MGWKEVEDMKQKVSDYIADRLAQEGICQVFTVTGGGAMHLNDSLGHHPGLSCLYQHHEQAAAMAAEAYARVDNRMAAVCVTSGPGATNAITGVLCAWMDSIPMIVLSGQVRYDTTVRHSGLKIRTMGVQEYDITPSVEPMTKYAVMVTDPLTIQYHLERAIYLAKTGRPGPCWLDLPLNIQSAIIETDDLRAYDPKEDEKELPAPVTEEKYKEPEPGRTNIYAFYDSLSKVLPEGEQILVSVGTSRVAGSQAIYLKKGQRFYTNAVTASMGYGLPAAIGVCVGSGEKEVICVNGEGCMQMNLQELQTIRHHNLPIRIFVINNEGYHSIRQTQTAYFGGHLVGVGEESGDLSFPDLSRLAPAYGFAYKECRNSATLEEDLRAVMEVPAPVICQVFVSKLQKTEPKLASRQLPDGTMVSASLEDMYPFLSREEMEEEGVLWKE